MYSETVLTKSQKNEQRSYFSEGKNHFEIIARIRHDDQCGNGHNTFSITGEIWAVTTTGRRIGGDCVSCGCIHEEIAKHFPLLAPMIKWHLCTADGPHGYVANAIYHAGDKDCWGLRKDEKRQLQNGRTKMLVWERVMRDSSGNAVSGGSGNWLDSVENPTEILTAAWEPVWKIGEGKKRELNHARSSAIWPEATDEQLMSPDLEQMLKDRLPQLMTDFKTAVESLGFIY